MFSSVNNRESSQTNYRLFGKLNQKFCSEESNEDNNFLIVQQKIGSNFGILDVGVEIVAQYSVPAIILSATVALMGVAGVVMYGRRMEAISRFNEKSSLISNIDEEDMIF